MLSQRAHPTAPQRTRRRWVHRPPPPRAAGGRAPAGCALQRQPEGVGVRVRVRVVMVVCVCVVGAWVGGWGARARAGSCSHLQRRCKSANSRSGLLWPGASAQQSRPWRLGLPSAAQALTGRRAAGWRRGGGPPGMLALFQLATSSLRMRVECAASLRGCEGGQGVQPQGSRQAAGIAAKALQTGQRESCAVLEPAVRLCNTWAATCVPCAHANSSATRRHTRTARHCTALHGMSADVRASSLAWADPVAPRVARPRRQAGVPQEVCVLLNAGDAKGAALAAGRDSQVVVLDKETQPVLCTRGAERALSTLCAEQSASWQGRRRLPAVRSVRQEGLCGPAPGHTPRAAGGPPRGRPPAAHGPPETHSTSLSSGCTAEHAAA